MNTKNRVLFSEKYINKLFLLCFCVWWNPLNYISLIYTIYNFTTFIFIIFCVRNIFFYYRVFKKFLKETYFHTNGKLQIINVICVCILQCKELFIYLAILALTKSRRSLRLVAFFTWKFSYKLTKTSVPHSVSNAKESRLKNCGYAPKWVQCSSNHTNKNCVKPEMHHRLAATVEVFILRTTAYICIFLKLKRQLLQYSLINPLHKQQLSLWLNNKFPFYHNQQTFRIHAIA